MNELTPTANASNGRQSNGRFAPGNPGGPGNPNIRRLARLKSVLMKTVTRDEMRQVVVAMLAEAKAGNVQAAQLLLDRVMGKVAVALEVSGPEGSTVQIEQRVTDLAACLALFEQFNGAKSESTA